MVAFPFIESRVARESNPLIKLEVLKSEVISISSIISFAILFQKQQEIEFDPFGQTSS